MTNSSNQVEQVLGKLGIIKVSGRYGTGKTLFGLTCPSGPILHLDTEFSSEAYSGVVEFTRMDIRSLVDLRVILGIGTPTTEQSERGIFAIGDTQFGTIVLDTIPTIEDWLVEEIHSIGGALTAGDRLSGLGWGELKRRERGILMRLRQKCKILIITAHMRLEFAGKRPTGRYQPKGKETISELASLSIILERDQNNQIPSAIVEKSRLLSSDMVPMLPPRIPQCTWEHLVSYLLKPSNWDELSDEEKAEKRMNIQELLSMMKEAGVNEDEPDTTA